MINPFILNEESTALTIANMTRTLPYPRIDTTSFTIDQTADRGIEIVQEHAS